MARISSTILIIIGTIITLASLWINQFQLKGKFTFFLFIGFIIIIWGILKIPSKKQKIINKGINKQLNNQQSQTRKHPKIVYCKNCGAPMYETDNFCRRCGAPR